MKQTEFSEATRTASAAVNVGGPPTVSAPNLPPSSLLRSVRALYGLSLRQHQHGKRWLMVAILLSVPALLAGVLRLTSASVPREMLEFFLAFMFMPQALVPLTALIYASGVIQDEQEDQTLTYLLTRPVPKWLIYMTKLAAAITVMVILLVLADILTYGAIYIGAGHGAVAAARCAKACVLTALAATVYGCLFGLIGMVTRRVLVVGLIYIALVEGLLANLPFSIRLLTVIYYTRLIAYRWLAFIVPTSHGTSQNLAADNWKLALNSHGELMGYPQSVTCILVLLAGGVVCTLLAAWLCNLREFYVKTPEKM